MQLIKHTGAPGVYMNALPWGFVPCSPMTEFSSQVQHPPKLEMGLMSCNFLPLTHRSGRAATSTKSSVVDVPSVILSSETFQSKRLIGPAPLDSVTPQFAK